MPVTNAIESVNMGLRKLTKNRGSFPSDEALTKLFYLALRNISQKWTMPIRDWKAEPPRFLRRLYSLRGLSHEEDEQVLA